MDVADELLTDNFVNHRTPPGIPPDRAGYKQWGAIFRAAFPDQKQVADDIVAEADKVAIRWSSRATHKGEFMGIAPTGKRIALTGITMIRIVGGKCVEDWTEFDALGLIQQLGIVPPPGQG